MVFLKALYETLKWSVLLGFVIFLLSFNGVNVFDTNVNNYGTYLIIFLFFLTAQLSATY